MAHITHRETLSCRCCGLKARRTEWSCGCVTIDFDRRARACGSCDDFGGMRRSCGKSGPPGS